MFLCHISHFYTVLFAFPLTLPLASFPHLSLQSSLFLLDCTSSNTSFFVVCRPLYIFLSRTSCFYLSLLPPPSFTVYSLRPFTSSPGFPLLITPFSGIHHLSRVLFPYLFLLPFLPTPLITVFMFPRFLDVYFLLTPFCLPFLILYT